MTHPLQVIRARCNGCGQCVAVCPFDGIRMDGALAQPTAACRLCGLCLDACSEAALRLDEGETSNDAAPAAALGVMVVAEWAGDGVAPVTVELIGAGRRLAEALGEPLQVIAVGADRAAAAASLLPYGMDRIWLVEHEELRDFDAERFTTALEGVVRAQAPSILLAAGTPQGRSWAPRLATRLRTGLTADCTSLEVNSAGDLLQTRPAFGGNIMATIRTPHRRPQMATVRPGVLAPAEAVGVRGVLRVWPLTLSLPRGAEVLSREAHAPAATVAEADRIVAVGRGLRRREDLPLFEALAQRLGASLACTRPLVEAGWLPKAHQVGLSGRSVRPRLYIACGIRGAIQHVAGMKASDFIIAINRDPEAPIFHVADVALVGDVYEIVPRLLEQWKEDDPRAELSSD